MGTLTSLFTEAETNTTYSKITGDLVCGVRSKLLHRQCVLFLNKLEGLLSRLPFQGVSGVPKKAGPLHLGNGRMVNSSLCRYKGWLELGGMGRGGDHPGNSI